MLHEVAGGLDRWGVPVAVLKALAFEGLPHALVAPWESERDDVGRMVVALADVCAGGDPSYMGNARRLLSPPCAPYPNSHDYMVASGAIGAPQSPAVAAFSLSVG